MDEGEAKTLLKRYRIPTTNFIVASKLNEIDKVKLKSPMVMKVCSSKLLHKTDVGGVILNINSKNELKNSFKKLKRKFPEEKILIEEMEKKGTEIIVGMIKDEFFGKVIMVGIGGIFTEIYKDVSFRKLPIDENDANEMLMDLKAHKIFENFRIKLDKKSLVELIYKISKIVAENKILQMDLNPVFLYEKGLKVIDAKVILE
ncbi:MAG: acetate--CoA ligase family protein [Thermoplasmata archaeon]|nr:acetate--CoA ligase family protein [Thermoplasmata archaeon]